MNGKVMLGAVLITMLTITGCTNNKQGSIVGTWEGQTDDGEVLVMTCTAEGKVHIRVDDDGGDGTYQVDFSVTPAHLDLDLGKRGKVKTVFRLPDDNRLEIEDSKPGNPRPETFTDTAVLTRKG